MTTQVASVDRFGVVRKEARNSSSDISIERKDTHTYMLNIHGTQDRWVYVCVLMAKQWWVISKHALFFSTFCWLEDWHYAIVITTTISGVCVCFVVSSDSGEYHCTATPWYLSASTGAWTQAGELTSSRVFLTVRFAGEECLLDLITVHTWTMSTLMYRYIYHFLSAFYYLCFIDKFLPFDFFVWTEGRKTQEQMH